MRALLDVGNLCVLLGIVALGVACWVPSWSAARVARVENRALEVAEELLALVRAERSVTSGDSAPPEDREASLAALRAACLRRGQPNGDLPALESTDASLPATFGNRHYLFRVQPRAMPDGVAEPGDGARVLEVFAWPRNLLPPGRSVFCLGEDGKRAYTRNLIANFAGLDHAPPPDAALPRSESVDPANGSYRAANDERWLPLLGS